MLCNLSPGVLYLTLGTAEQVQWVLTTNEIDHTLHVLYHPTNHEIRAALEYSDPFADKPRVYLIFPGSLSKQGGAHALPRDKTLTVNKENYYFFVCSLLSGDIKLIDEDGHTLDATSNVKAISGKPYERLDLYKLDYGFEKTPEAQFHHPFPRSFQRKLDGDYGLVNHQDCLFLDYEQQLIESLPHRDGYKLWSQLTSSQVYAYFSNPNRSDYPLFTQGNLSGLSCYLQPFVEIYEASPFKHGYNAPLALFAQWCYFTCAFWSDGNYTGLVTYTPKRGRYKEKGVTKAYLFKPSARARLEWYNILQGEWSKKLLQRRPPSG